MEMFRPAAPVDGAVTVGVAVAGVIASTSPITTTAAPTVIRAATRRPMHSCPALMTQPLCRETTRQAITCERFAARSLESPLDRDLVAVLEVVVATDPLTVEASRRSPDSCRGEGGADV